MEGVELRSDYRHRGRPPTPKAGFGLALHKGPEHRRLSEKAGAGMQSLRDPSSGVETTGCMSSFFWEGTRGHVWCTPGKLRGPLQG